MIEEYRKEIDTINREIIDLLAKRAALSHKIGEIKKTEGKEIYDPSREERILNKVAEIATEKGINPELTKDIFKTIFKFSYDTQK